MFGATLGAFMFTAIILRAAWMTALFTTSLNAGSGRRGEAIVRKLRYVIPGGVAVAASARSRLPLNQPVVMAQLAA